LQFVGVNETQARVNIFTEILGKPFCHDDGRDLPELKEESEIKEVLRQFLKPIEYLHSLNIVHRDIKPENYLHDPREAKLLLKLIDYGMIEEESKIPQNPLWLGKLQYQSPEMVSQLVYDRKIDIWAFGVMTYLLFEGKLPFYDERKNRFVIIEKIKEAKFDTTARIFQDVRALRFLERLLQVDPAQRCTVTEAMEDAWIIVR